MSSYASWQLQDLREHTHDVIGAVPEFLWRHRSAWALYAASALLLSHVGAFHTGETPLALKLPYFLSLALSSGLLAVLCLNLIEGRTQLSSAARAAAAVGIVTLLQTPIVWVAAALALEGSWQPARMVQLAFQVLPVLALLIPLQLMLERKLGAAEGEVRRPGMMNGPGPIAQPQETSAHESLTDKLPPHLRGAELLAVEAEDHYLRLHTDRGSAMLLMSLTEAIALLGEGEGARTHRSWWVARTAVSSVSRRGGRATLLLRNGVAAPVSRTYAPGLRSSGWFSKG